MQRFQNTHAITTAYAGGTYTKKKMKWLQRPVIETSLRRYTIKQIVA
jgi:hypothetical protein